MTVEAVSDRVPLGPCVLVLTGRGHGDRRQGTHDPALPATQGLKPKERIEYAYDGLDRLVGVRYADGRIEAYRLDEVGNRTGERATEPGPVQAGTAVPGRH